MAGRRQTRGDPPETRGHRAAMADGGQAAQLEVYELLKGAHFINFCGDALCISERHGGGTRRTERPKRGSCAANATFQKIRARPSRLQATTDPKLRGTRRKDGRVREAA